MLKKWNQSMGNEKSTAYLMVFPTAVIITLLGIVPILYVVWLSLCKVNPVTMETEFAGLQNYTGSHSILRSYPLRCSFFWECAWRFC